MSSKLLPSDGTTLGEIVQRVPGSSLHGGATTPVHGVHQDSRQIEHGDIFAVRSGGTANGADFVEQARRKGAVALLVCRADSEKISGHSTLPYIEVDDVVSQLGAVAEIVYRAPLAELEVVGVTGTNGKTTTVCLVEWILLQLGHPTATAGTLGYGLRGRLRPSSHTTPEADEVVRIAAEARRSGATHLVMEVSSHALANRRVEHVPFRVAALTNLTQDHLDFHGDMEAYGRAKRRLFVDLAPASIVLNVDDPFARRLFYELGEKALRVAVVQTASADIALESAEYRADGTTLRVHTPEGPLDVRTPLVGEHNVANVLVALGIAHQLGLSLENGASSLASFPAAPGRLEVCSTVADDITLLVDYAHTPDALARVLDAVRKTTTGNIVCVFGCGGDRDSRKRGPMGAIVEQRADIAILTSDNPRSEAPEAIAEGVLAGVTDRSRMRVELDRARAIGLAAALARPGDVVLVCGKGHESYQEISGVRQSFDDREVGRSALTLRRARGNRSGEGAR